MSEPSHSNDATPQGPERPARGRHGCLTAVMILVGIVLLLPGMCALAFTSVLGGSGVPGVGLWLVCMLVSAGGIALIVKASR